MLKVLYVHDHIFKNCQHKFYSEGKITDEVFSRYIVDSMDEVYVLSRMEKIENSSFLTEIENKQVFFKPVRGLTLLQIYFFNIFFNLKRIFFLLKKTDFVILRMPSFLGVLVFLLSVLFQKKIFVEFVGDPKESLLNAVKSHNFLVIGIIKILAFLNKLVLYKANGVIYVTKSYLQSQYPTLSYQTYASNVEIDVENICLSFDSYCQKDENFKIGIMASFNNYYKGIDIAIEAISILKDKGILVDLHILGSGKLQKEYEIYSQQLNISHQILFDGRLSLKKDINLWLDSLDIYIQPSRTEGLPRALIEAMSRGLPAVATDVGGIPELLDQKFLIKPNSASALADKLQTLLLSQQLRFEQGVLNYRVSKEYDSAVLKERRQEFWKNARKIVERSKAI